MAPVGQNRGAGCCCWN